MYYPPAIKEVAPSSSKVRDALEEAEAAGPGVVMAITSPDDPAKESEPFVLLRRVKARTLMHPRRL